MYGYSLGHDVKGTEGPEAVCTPDIGWNGRWGQEQEGEKVAGQVSHKPDENHWVPSKTIGVRTKDAEQASTWERE